MAKKEKKYFYPVRNADNPYKVTLEPITEEQYRALYPEIWRTQKQMKKLGRCTCPKYELWTCNADCLVCKHCTFGNQTSLYEPIDGNEDIELIDTIENDAPTPESIALDRALLDALYQALEELDPEGQRICELLMNHSERESADIMGMPRSTFKRHWNKVKSKLFEKLKDFK